MNRREESTAPDRLNKNARNHPLALAYRAKTLGTYKGRTWQQYAEAVERAALILAAVVLRQATGSHQSASV
jgi:long-subunit acyl-CoA synthetase (AMP-forming)